MNEETEAASWHEDQAYEQGRREMAHEFYAAVEDRLPDGYDDFESFSPELLRRLWVMKSSIEFHYDHDPDTIRINRFDAWDEGFTERSRQEELQRANPRHPISRENPYRSVP